jgi:hypothetical protein
MIGRNKQKPPVKRRSRLVPRSDDYQIVRVGYRPIWFSDLYVKLLEISWTPLFVLVALLYFLSNTLFAEFYYFS